jgi:hypothetical protein
MGDMSDSPTVEEAMERPDWPQFKQAMDVEMEAMRRTGTFGSGLVPRPIGRNVVGSKSCMRSTWEVEIISAPIFCGRVLSCQ